MDSHSPEASASPYALLFRAASLIPASHYFSLVVFVSLLFGYNFLEFHFFQDLVLGFRGTPVSLTFNSCSEIYDGVASKCRTLHGRYLATPWLSNPHLQTAFLNFFGRPPSVSYRRRLFHTSDGGTIALDWLMSSDVLGGSFHDSTISRDDTTPIVVLIPGLTSDSAAAYVKHFSFNMAKHGWNVVISNHRGLGGISITSDCFYNAGWTADAREVIKYLHHEFPKAPLFVVGTSIGANVLVKYLGEDGEDIPVAGAAAISSPWDLLIGDRFITRRFVQKLYDRALASGLIGYAQLHQPRWSRLADWEGIEKSRSIRDFDMYATCCVGKFETVDTYYRRCSSASYVGNVAVPLLCISALDDPVCTKEAIPWDECRANKNIVLATTQHGGHLAFFEGKSASGLWWVRAVIEFLSVLHSSPHMHRQRKPVTSVPHCVLEPSIDQGPYVNVGGDGMVAAMGNEPSIDEIASNVEQDEGKIEETSESDLPETTRSTVSSTEETRAHDVILCFRKCLTVFSQQNKWSVWLLAYIAIVTSCPLLGSVLFFFKKKKLRNVLPAFPRR